MNVKSSVKKIAAIATGALFLGATVGAAAVFGSGLSGFGSGALGYVTNGAVTSVVVVGSQAQPADILGAIDVASALTAAAASTHTVNTGKVTIGTLSLSATAEATAALNGNDTTFSWSKHSANLDKVNWTGTGKQNYTSVENVTFVTASKPYTNGLNVVVPIGGLQVASYVINRSASNALVSVAAGLTYLIGTTQETVISVAGSTNYTVGVQTTFTDVKVPSVLTVGANSVNLAGIATITGSSPSNSYNQLEFSVNGGSVSYLNFSAAATVSGVTVTLGKTAITNTSGTFLSSLAVSSTGLRQNYSAANVFGLGAYNATAQSTKYLNFSNTVREKLNSSFSAASSFALPASLSTISLEPLTPLYTGGSSVNLTVSVGASGTDKFVPKVNNTAAVSGNVYFNYTQGLPNVVIGSDYRANLGASGIGSPDLLLESNQSFYNISSGKTVSAVSEILYPNTHSATTFANTSTKVTTYPSSFNGKTVRLVYELPNGVYLAVQLASVADGAHQLVGNATTLLNYTASTTGSPTIRALSTANKVYSFNGYNLTTGNYTAGVHDLVGFNLSGPVAEVTGYSIVPGYSGLVATNGSSYVNAALANGMGKLSFSGSVLTYTDPLGLTQTVDVAENTTNFGTYILSPTNTSANKWGDYVTNAGKALGAKIVVPTENYTLALGGSQIISGRTNYTVGQTVTSGELLSVGGASAVSASGLFGSGVFPLAELDTSFTGSTNSVPVVVVGGPCVNSLAGTLLNIVPYSAACATDFVNDTGVTASGQALVELFSDVAALGHQNAVLIAGYSASDSLNAAEVVSEYLLGTPVVNLNGTKMILSTGSASYSGVTVKSEQ